MLFLRILSVLLTSLLVVPPTAYAGPTDGVFVQGAGTIEEPVAGSGDFEITASDGAVIEYSEFNVPTGESVTFIQPGETARVLNRILDVDPTRIDGNVMANGIVYFINPAGVVFGAGAVIDVAGLYAAAGDLSDADFAAGIDHFTSLTGDVRNEGDITASLVHLIGGTVTNLGSIDAPDGVIAFSAGSDVFITTPGGGLVVQITGPAAAVAGPGVDQSGTVDAGSGRVALSAGDLYALAVNHDGTSTGGTITVDGGDGDVTIGGALDASGTAGGTIDVATSGDVTLDAGSVLGGGGSVSISGDAIRGADLEDGAAEIVANGSALEFTAGSGGVSDASGAGALELSGTAVDVTSGGDTRIADAGDLDLANVDVQGVLEARATGALTDSGSVAVTGDATFAGSSITLDQLDVDGSIAATSTGSTTLVNQGATDLGAASVGADLSATAVGGALTDSGAVDVTGDATFAGSSITLDQLDVDGSIAATSTGNTTLVNQGNTDLAGISAGGNFSVLAVGGRVTDSAAMDVTGTADVRTRRVGAEDTDVRLDHADTTVGGIAVHTLDNPTANVVLSNQAGWRVDALEATGAISVDGGTDGDVTIVGGPSGIATSFDVAGHDLVLASVATDGTQTYTARGDGRIAANGTFETLLAGSIRFLGPVDVSTALGISTSGGTFGADVLFGSTVDGPGTLLVLARENAEVRFVGDIGSTTPLGSLNVVSAGTHELPPMNIRVPGIVFEGTHVTADTISLNVPLGGDGIRAGQALIRPTIVGTGSELHFNAADLFEVGRGERLSLPGPLHVDTALARIGDLAATEIHIVAPRIEMLPRPAGDVELAGNRTVNDLGLDIVANEIWFSSAPVLVGGGPLPFFVTPTATELSAALAGQQRRYYNVNGGSILVSDLASRGRQFDLTGTGPQVLADGSQLSLEAQYGSWTRPPEQMQDNGPRAPGVIGGGRLQQLRGNRPLWSEDVMAFLGSPSVHGSSSFSLWSAGTSLGHIGGSGTQLRVASRGALPEVSGQDAEESDAARQLRVQQAGSALSTYHALRASGDRMTSLLESAARAYQTERGDPAASVADFARYLQSDGRYGGLVEHLDGYNGLLGTLQSLYLTETEFESLKGELLRGVGPADVPVEGLVRAVATLRGH